MKKISQWIMTFSLMLLPLWVAAEAPVVDESENYSLLNKNNQAANEQPLAKDFGNNASEDMEYPDEQPLAHDSSSSGSIHDSASILNRLQSLQQEVQELRGQLEVQSHELKTLREQQLSFYKDIDSRIKNPSISDPSNLPESSTITPSQLKKTSPKPKKMRTAKTTEVIPAPTIAFNGENPADEQIRYLAAYDLVKSKQISQAILAMQSFTSQYPHSGYTPTAHFWLGELYREEKDYANAIKHFDTVVNQYPHSNKSAESLLKWGYSLAEAGNSKEARIKLNQVIKQYPDTQTALLAESKLKTMSS